MSEPAYDLAVIGGGINGAGIAADAAGRGLKVILIEMADLGGATSSASSKLIHGGLRYLEQYEFRLVREALQEREVLLARAPHIIWPMRFVLPHVESMRPRVLIRAGLFLYDHLARRRRLQASSAVDLHRDPAGSPLIASLKHGFSYWDCWADDARLVIANAREASRRGARILTRTKLSGLRVVDGGWQLILNSGGREDSSRARVLVNAAGPWADDVSALAFGAVRGNGPPRVRLVKGSHIVVPRIAGAEDAYLLQNKDGRVVFAMPFEQDFTLIGTTDVPFEGDRRSVAISDGEVTYLLDLANEFFAVPLSRQDVVWSFAGVRPLYDDAEANPSAVSRDYRLDVEQHGGGPVMITVLGGKVTTYRRLAEAVLEKVRDRLPPMGSAWTATSVLPGGDIPGADFDRFIKILALTWPRFPAGILRQLGRRYGSETAAVLGEAQTVADMGAGIGGGLSEREVAYLRDTEWARTPDDVMWRRTKAGLHIKTDAGRQLAAERIAKLL